MKKLVVQGNGKTHEASARRMINLEFIEKLPLDGLEYKKKERALLLYVTEAGEEIYLQYPGKESERDKNANPRDFRPKIYKNGTIGKDLSFGSVWESFFDLLKKYSVKDKDFLISLDHLIFLLYKSAYLIGFEKRDTPIFKTRTLQNGEVLDEEKVKYYSPVLLYDIKEHLSLISFIQEKIGNLSGMSVEAFILYNDILGWNEDYKYYCRAIKKGKQWAGGTGKPNTLQTHISILGYIRGEFNMTDILNRFVRTRGVSAPNMKEMGVLFDDFVNPSLAASSNTYLSKRKLKKR